MGSESTLVDNVYTVRLTEHHKHLLRSAHPLAHGHLLHFNVSYSTCQLVNETVGCFNSWHVEAIRAATPGGN